MTIKWHSGSIGTYDPTPIGDIPDAHGRYEFNPNNCIRPGTDVIGGGLDRLGNWIGPDKCVRCGPKVPPPPPPPPISAEVYSITICFWLSWPDGGAPQGCWYYDHYVNWDGPPPLTFDTQSGPLTIPHLYDGQTLDVSTSYGYSINGVITHVGDLDAQTGSVYVSDPNNPSAPAAFSYDATRVTETNVINDQLAEARSALGI